MRLVFVCDYCGTAHATADGCGKCERACAEEVLRTKWEVTTHPPTPEEIKDRVLKVTITKV